LISFAIAIFKKNSALIAFDSKIEATEIGTLIKGISSKQLNLKNNIGLLYSGFPVSENLIPQLI
jgi:hypothetical protein